MTGSAKDPAEQARTIALRKLNAGPHSVAQIRTALAKADIPEAVADAVITRYVDVGLLNDVEYAAMLVRTKHTMNGKARRAIAEDLRKAGIDQTTAEVALTEIDVTDEHLAAKTLVAKKLPSLLRYDDQVIIRRLAGQLARRGFDSETSYAVITEALQHARHGE